MKNIIAKIFILSGILICSSLSFWQIKRMEYKENLIAELQNKLELPITKLKNIDSVEEYLYRKVEVCGIYAKENLFIYHKPDYIILSPFIIDGINKKIMVAKGSISQSKKPTFINREYKDCITGIIMPSEKKPLFMPEADGTRQRPMLSIHMDSISEILSTKLSNIYILLLDKSDNLEPMKVPTPERIYNNHLEYAITWAMLAIILAFMATSSRKQ